MDFESDSHPTFWSDLICPEAECADTRLEKLHLAGPDPADGMVQARGRRVRDAVAAELFLMILSVR